MKKMTIREIAQMANVSQTAVSFVLNNKPGVSDETRKRVLEIIERTHFQSDRNSKRLALNKSFNICLAYFDTFSPFNDLFYVEVAKSMIDGIGAYGYNIIMSKFVHDGDKIKLPEAITAAVQGTILTGQPEDVNSLAEPDKVAPVTRSAAAEDGPKPDDNEGEVIVAKQRNGPVGTVNVEWQAEFARYTNLPGTRVAVYAE